MILTQETAQPVKRLDSVVPPPIAMPTLGDLLEACAFAFVNPQIPDRYPVLAMPAALTEMDVYHTSAMLCCQCAVVEMAEKFLRPATVPELLVYTAAGRVVETLGALGSEPEGALGVVMPFVFKHGSTLSFCLSGDTYTVLLAKGCAILGVRMPRP